MGVPPSPGALNRVNKDCVAKCLCVFNILNRVREFSGLLSKITVENLSLPPPPPPPQTGRGGGGRGVLSRWVEPGNYPKPNLKSKANPDDHLILTDQHTLWRWRLSYDRFKYRIGQAPHSQPRSTNTTYKRNTKMRTRHTVQITYAFNLSSFTKHLPSAVSRISQISSCCTDTMVPLVVPLISSLSKLECFCRSLCANCDSEGPFTCRDGRMLRPFVPSTIIKWAPRW